MKHMNRFVSIALSVVLVCSMFTMSSFSEFDSAGMVPTASAVGTQSAGRIDSYVANAFADIDDYLASYENLADSFDYYRYVGRILTSSPAVDLINWGNEKYTIAESYVRDVANDEAFMASYAVWKMSGYITDPIDAIYDGTGITSFNYYSSILIKCLECEFKSDNLIDSLNKDCVKNTTSILKNISKVYKAGVTESYANSVTEIKEIPISELMKDEKEYAKICENAKSWVESNVKDTLGTVLLKDVSYISDLLKMSSNLEKFAEKIASFATISLLPDSVGKYMEHLAQFAGDNKLGDACNEMASIISDAVVETVDHAIFDGITSIGKQFFSKLVSKVWKGVLADLTNGFLSTGTRLIGGATLAITIGRSIGDICFSTSKQLDKYEMLKCYCDVLNMQRQSLVSLINSYSGTNEQAAMLSEAVDLLYQTYAVGSDLTQSALDVFNGSLIHFSSDADYRAASNGIASEKSYYSNQYNELIRYYLIASINSTASWMIQEDGTLLIIGSGNVNSAPWQSRANEIRRVYVSSYITSLGDNLFAGTSLNDGVIVLDGVSSFTGSTFAGINPNCSIVFNHDVTCSGGLTGDYPIYAEKKITLGDTNVKSIFTKGYLFAGSLTVRNEAVIGGTAEFSQWGAVTIANGATLVCNMFVGNSWAYVAGNYNTAVNNDGTIIACTKAYGYIDYTGTDNATFTTARLVGDQIRINGGTVTVEGETNLISSENTRVVLKGGSGSSYSISGTLKSLDIYSDGITISNVLVIKDYVDFHGFDVSVSSYLDLINGAKAIEGSNYKSLRLVDGYYLKNNIWADAICIDRNLYVTSGNYTLTGDVSGNIRGLSYGLSISSGAKLTIDGNLYGTKNFVYCSEIYNNGTLVVTGTTIGDIYFKYTGGKYYLNNVVLFESGTEGGVYHISGNVDKMTISDNSSYDFCGDEAQTVVLNGNLGKCEINNRKGVTFVNGVNSTILFNHNLNPFVLQKGGSFVDYDKDGLKDNVDPLPLIAQPFDTEVLNHLSVKMKLHSGSSFDQYYWEVTEIPEGSTSIEIPSIVGEIPVRVIDDDVFSACDSLRSVTLYPGLYDVSQLHIDKSVVIRGYAGSPAQRYAENSEHPFESIGNISSIRIHTLPNKKDFSIKDSFSADGLLINVFTDDGKSYTTNEFETSGFDHIPGIKTITVSYADAEAVYQVIVSEFAYSYLNDQDIEITEYFGTDVDLYIPNDVFGRNVKSISSLGNISQVETISLPTGLTSVSSTAFNNATGLKSIKVEEENSTFTSKDGVLFSSSGETVIRCPIAVDNKEMVIDETVTEINGYAFANCDLTSVLLPTSLVKIGKYAFLGNDFTTLTIPESVTSLGNNCFEGCRKLKTVFYNAVSAKTGISTGFLAQLRAQMDAVFRNDSEIETINIGPKVKTLPTGFAAGLAGLKTINIAENADLNSVEKCAFVNDSALSDIYYNGYYKDWKQISVSSNNTPFVEATLHCVECDECTWNDGVIITEPTCVSTGFRLFTCTVCGKERTEVEPIDPIKHTGNTSIINYRATTCSMEGYTGDTVCSDCGAVLASGTVIEKIAHTWNEGSITQTPTCEAAGIKSFTCVNCPETKTEPIEPTGHVYGEWIKLDENQHQRLCANDNNHIETANHTWNEGGVTVVAKCDKEGVRTYTCSDCGATRTEAIEKISHTEVAVKGKSATCTQSGLTDGIKCSECGIFIQSQKTIPAIGHKYGEWKVIKAATCTAAGTEQRVCENDASHVETRIINAIGHKFGAWTVVKAPTCLTEGVERRICGNDKKHVETRSISKIAHVDRNNDGYCDNCRMDLGSGGQPHESNCVCGKNHTGPFAGIIKFFHKIVYFFNNLFSKN